MYYHRSKERGQAMAEYTAMIPAAVGILISVSVVGAVLVQAFTRVVESFEPYGNTCEVADNEEEQEGPTIASFDCHTVEMTAKVYDEFSDTTTITYEVTSACDPAISHWTLGIPAEVAANIISVSEKIEGFSEGADLASYWKDDPTFGDDGLTGIKFDTEYESTGGKPAKESDPVEEPEAPADEGTKPEKEPKNTSDVSSPFSYLVLASDVAAPTSQTIGGTADSVTRDVLITLTGQYAYAEVMVGVKYGTITTTNVITAPVQIYHDPELDENCEE